MTVTFQIGLGYSWSNKTTVCVEAEIMNYQSLWDNHVKLGDLSWSPLEEDKLSHLLLDLQVSTAKITSIFSYKSFCCLFLLFCQLFPPSLPFLPSHTFCLITCQCKYPERNPWIYLDPQGLVQQICLSTINSYLTFQNMKLWKLPLALENVRHSSQMLSIYKHNLQLGAYLLMDFFFPWQKPQSLKPGMKFQRLSPYEKLQDQKSGEF